MAYENAKVEELFLTAEDKMDRTISALKTEYISIRAGRANLHILDKVMVDYYGTPTPINQMANLSAPEARVLTVAVWDASALKSVEKAIIAANIGLTPNNDGKVIRLVFPELTEERRKELAKQVKKMAEDSKVSVRNERRDLMEQLKRMNKDKEITEDELGNYEKDVDKLTSKYIDTVENIYKDKEKEVLSV